MPERSPSGAEPSDKRGQLTLPKPNAHPSSWSGESKNTAASRRVYDAIAPEIDRIKAATSPEDPAPEIVIDDTIPEMG